MIRFVLHETPPLSGGGGLRGEMGGQAERRRERTGLDQGRAMKGEQGADGRDDQESWWSGCGR